MDVSYIHCIHWERWGCVSSNSCHTQEAAIATISQLTTNLDVQSMAILHTLIISVVYSVAHLWTVFDSMHNAKKKTMTEQCTIK